MRMSLKASWASCIGQVSLLVLCVALYAGSSTGAVTAYEVQQQCDCMLLIQYNTIQYYLQD
jgi:hypothetical protein